MLLLAGALLAFFISSWGGLTQWWQSIPVRRRVLYALLTLSFAALVVYQILK